MTQRVSGNSAIRLNYDRKKEQRIIFTSNTIYRIINSRINLQSHPNKNATKSVHVVTISANLILSF